MQNFSTCPVLRANYFRQMLPAPQFIRVGLSCAKVSQRSLKWRKIELAHVLSFD
jgi:hypothetical protein